MMTSGRSSQQTCPAAEASDDTFLEFCRECDEVIKDVEGSTGPPDAVLRLVEELVRCWRIKDQRFLACQPDSMYGSYLLYANTEQNLSVVLDVFMAGQAAVIHNHLCWCAFTCLDGLERERIYEVDVELAQPPKQIDERICPVGLVRGFGDGRNVFHQVECASNKPAVSLHIYGSDIGRVERDMWDEATNAYVRFKSGYSNDLMSLPVYYDGS